MELYVSSDLFSLDSDVLENTPVVAVDITQSLPNCTSAVPTNFHLSDNMNITSATSSLYAPTSASPSVSIIYGNLSRNKQQQSIRHISTPNVLFSNTKRPFSTNPDMTKTYSVNRVKTLVSSLVKTVTSTQHPPSLVVQSYRQMYLLLRRRSLELTREWRVYQLKQNAYEKRIKMGLKAIPPTLPSPTPRPPPIIEDANFSGMDPPSIPAVTHTYRRSLWKETETILIRQFVGNEEIRFSNHTVYPTPDQEYSVTYIAVGTSL